MREIKFRAWHFEKGWIYFGVEGIPKEIENDIDYSLVHQYTGLKDKNGVEICEGDIVNVIETDEDSCIGREYEYVCEVVYGSGGESKYVAQYACSFCIINTKFYREQALLHNERYEYEVIGNIYENPELLKDK